MSKATTIVAVSTPQAMSALAIIRLSGGSARGIAQKIIDRSMASWPSHSSRFCRIVQNDVVIDEVMLNWYQGPHTFTGEDTVEISCHGSTYIVQQILALLTQHGAVPAQAGEFTMRAFLNGKMDLSQAEAVADLIASESAAAHHIAMHQMRGGFSNEINSLREELIQFASLIELELDFAEEDVEFADRSQLIALLEKIRGIIATLIQSFEYGNAVKNGIPVAIAGAPNAGKSTLLNALLNEDKAIVSNIPGTTRDVIEDTVTLDGIQFRFIDTAGIRQHTDDEIEKLGIARSHAKIEQAQIVLYCGSAIANDNATGEDIAGAAQKVNELRSQYPGKKIFLIATKADHADALNEKDLFGALPVAAKSKNVEKLKTALVQYIQQLNTGYNNVVVTNVRHLNALNKAQASLNAAYSGLTGNTTADLVAMDIRATLHYLGEITGTISTEDLLGNIFSKFCIGK